MANLLSKIQIGGVLYDLKDAYAREQIALLLEDAAKHMDTTGIFADDKAVKEYVDAQVGSINKFDVAVVDAVPTASADTMYILYLVPNGNAESGEYIEYITIRSGNEEDGFTYKMEAIGSTKMDLTDYVTETELAEILKAYELKANLKALAYKDSATGTVDGQTISGVKATGNGVTGVNLTNAGSEKDVASTGKFTPAGNVSGTVTPTGKVAVTVSTSAADATLTKGDYTPAGTVSVSLNGNTFNAITGVGTQAQFTEGQFTAATLDREEVSANYATEGIVGSVDGETLTFTAAGIEALSATKVTGFTGGSKAADTFVANSLPTMAEQTVGVNSATFAGELASDLVVTSVSYAKANADAAATFTGDVNDIAASFAGTEADINVAGKYTDTIASAEAVTGAIELAVGDIAVAAKEVTVQ